MRRADFDDPASLTAAFAGADRLLLISTDAVDGTDRRKVQHRNAVVAAKQAGVKHVLYTSLTRPGPGSPILLAPDHHAIEQALAASSLAWTVLRNNVYTDLFLMSLLHAVATGQLVGRLLCVSPFEPRRRAGEATSFATSRLRRKQECRCPCQTTH